LEDYVAADEACFEQHLRKFERARLPSDLQYWAERKFSGARISSLGKSERCWEKYASADATSRDQFEQTVLVEAFICERR